MSNQLTEENNTRIRAYISEITFNNDENLGIKENDIVIFVEPNNAGKSQSLSDIYTKSGSNQPMIVVKDVKDHREEGSLLPLIKTVSKVVDVGNQYTYVYKGTHYGYNKSNGDETFKVLENFGQYRDLFICKLNTENRLGICEPTSILNRDQSWTNPIHYAAFDTKHKEFRYHDMCSLLMLLPIRIITQVHIVIFKGFKRI